MHTLWSEFQMTKGGFMLMRIHWSTARIFLLSLIVLCLAVCAAAAVSNGTETIITTDTQGSLQQNPAIDTTRIVWDDQRSGWEMNTIYSYDLATGKEYQVLP